MASCSSGRPKEAAIIAENAGTIQFGRDYKNKRRINLIPHDGSETVEYLVPKSKHVYHQDGDLIEKGDFIVDGNPAPHDILAIKGVEELAAYLVTKSRRSTGFRASTSTTSISR